VKTASLATGTASIADFRLASDGSMLYVADSQFRIWRVRTSTLEVAGEIQLPADAAALTSGTETRLRVRALVGSPDSVLISTAGGRLFLYDGDIPRAYSSTDFPASFAKVLDAVAATGSYAYAVARPETAVRNACLIRYPIDSLGLAAPEQLCNLPSEWGKYPEMVTHPGSLTLEVGNEVYQIAVAPDVGQALAAETGLEPGGSYGVMLRLLSYVSTSRTAAYQVEVSDSETREPIGHLPAADCLTWPDTLFFASAAMVVGQTISLVKSVTIIPDWRAELEPYR
jgi:hypothetical protein